MKEQVARITGAGSGDMAILHSAKNESANQFNFNLQATGLGKRDAAALANQNNMKTIEMI